jgi:hypothetical protein
MRNVLQKDEKGRRHYQLDERLITTIPLIPTEWAYSDSITMPIGMTG